MNIHAFIHTPFEKPGYIEEWSNIKNHNLSFTHFYETYELPDINKIDWLIVMGGPMGVYDEDKFPWLAEEKKFIKKAIEANKVVLGICLGSQLIAEVLGANIYANKFKEIGWFKIKTSPEAKNIDLFSHFPEETYVFHWHGNTYNLPEGAIHLAESEVCKNQAYIYNNRVIGLQFHFEVTEKLINEMLEGGIEELVEGEYIQSAQKIRNNISYCRQTNKILHDLLDKLEDKFNN